MAKRFEKLDKTVNCVIVNIPSEYNFQFDDPEYEKCLNDAMLDCVELNEDENLRKEISANKRIKCLSEKLDLISCDL